MLPLSSQLKTPLTAIIFDCDGTLSSIEGIDELAEKNGVGNLVRDLTAKAMGETGLNPELYRERLDIILPTQKQVFALAQHYLAHLTQDATQVIQILQRLGKEVYIVSAGLYPAVASFGEALTIPRQNVFAVNLQFDQHGEYLNFDETSPLIQNEGKRIIVSKLIKKHSQVAYVGDGLNDCAVIDLVTRFIGFGGHFYRENIAALCQYYLTQTTLASLLPLVLTAEEYTMLTTIEKKLYEAGS
jgi:phosphoserine phosphatase